MELNVKECNLLISIFNAGITNAVNSGIPIGKEYYNTIDSLREKLEVESQNAAKRGQINGINH